MSRLAHIRHLRDASATATEPRSRRAAVGATRMRWPLDRGGEVDARLWRRALRAQDHCRPGTVSSSPAADARTAGLQQDVLASLPP